MQKLVVWGVQTATASPPIPQPCCFCAYLCVHTQTTQQQSTVYVTALWPQRVARSVPLAAVYHGPPARAQGQPPVQLSTLDMRPLAALDMKSVAKGRRQGGRGGSTAGHANHVTPKGTRHYRIRVPPLIGCGGSQKATSSQMTAISRRSAAKAVRSANQRTALRAVDPANQRRALTDFPASRHGS